MQIAKASALVDIGPLDEMLEDTFPNELSAGNVWPTRIEFRGRGRGPEQGSNGAHSESANVKRTGRADSLKVRGVIEALVYMTSYVPC